MSIPAFVLVRTVLFGVALIGLATSVLGQHGTVVYEERVRIEIDLPPAMEVMRDRIPTENLTKRRLLFDGSSSLMTNLPQEEEQLELAERRRGMRFSFGGGQDNTEMFIDRESRQMLERRDFFNRTFIINDSLADLSWRLTGERAEFMGYMTMQAIARTSDTTTVEAWFAPQIPVPVGPGRYGDLPGLILMLSEDGGRRSYVAQEVSLEQPDLALLRAPTGGRTVTADEFDRIVEERMRELGVPDAARRGFRPRR